MLNKVQDNESDDILRRKALIFAAFKEEVIPYLQIQQDGKITLIPNKNHNYDISQNDSSFSSKDMYSAPDIEYSFSSDLLKRIEQQYLLRISLRDNMGDENLNWIFNHYEYLNSKNSEIYYISNIIKNVFPPQSKHQYFFMDLEYFQNEKLEIQTSMKCSFYTQKEFYLIIQDINEPLKDAVFIDEFIISLKDFISIDFSENIIQEGGLAYIDEIIKSIKY